MASKKQKQKQQKLKQQQKQQKLNIQKQQKEQEINRVYNEIKDYGITKQQLRDYVRKTEQANRVLEQQRKSGIWTGNRTEFTYKTLGKAKDKEQLQKWLNKPDEYLKPDYLIKSTKILRENMEGNLEKMFGGAVSIKELTDRQLGEMVKKHPEFENLYVKSPDVDKQKELFGNLYDNTNKINMLVERYRKL